MSRTMQFVHRYTPRNPAFGLPGARQIRRTVTALALALALALGMGTGQASAVIFFGASGSPGALSVPRSMSGGFETWWLSGYPYNARYLTASPTDVYRSPATSGAQIVVVDYNVYTSPTGTAPWTFYSHPQANQATINAGTSSVRMPIFTARPLAAGTYYHVESIVTWWSIDGRTRLGQRRASWAGAGDYRCATPIPSSTVCYASAKGVFLT